MIDSGGLTLWPPNPADRPTLTLTFAPDLANLAMARLTLRRTMPSLDAETARLYFGAVTEIIVNAINAHHQTNSEDPITVEVMLGEHTRVTVSDHGGGFDPEQPRPPPGSGGLGQGIAIARAICPDMTIISGEGGTSVTLPHPSSDGLSFSPGD